MTFERDILALVEGDPQGERGRGKGTSLDDRPGPALPLTALDAERMVQRALDDGFVLRPRPASRRASPRSLSWAAAAVLVFLLGPPLGWAGLRLWTEVVQPALRSKPPADSLRPGTEKSRISDAEREGPEVDALDERLSPPSDRPHGLGRANSAAAGSESRAAHKGPSKRVRRGPSFEVPGGRGRSTAGSGQVALDEAPASVAELLARASRLRRAQHWRAAARLYARARRQAETAADAHVAGIAEGQLRLEHLGQPRTALRVFMAARRALPEGPLVAEAWLGIGDARDALGQPAQAEEAWRRVLQNHPRSGAARAARARLEDRDPRGSSR